jgi:hypothetical protein
MWGSGNSVASCKPLYSLLNPEMCSVERASKGDSFDHFLTVDNYYFEINA